MGQFGMPCLRRSVIRAFAIASMAESSSGEYRKASWPRISSDVEHVKKGPQIAKVSGASGIQIAGSRLHRYKRPVSGKSFTLSTVEPTSEPAEKNSNRLAALSLVEVTCSAKLTAAGLVCFKSRLRAAAKSAFPVRLFRSISLGIPYTISPHAKTSLFVLFSSTVALNLF